MGDLPQHLDGGWPNLRKRGRPELTENLSMSSDPAIFSSDDDPSVDNYVGGRRRKKQYVGSWFHSHELPAAEVTPARPPVKRTLTRQMDSGVWMGSDISDDLDALEKEHAEVTEASVAPEPADDLLWGAMDPAHQEAQRRVAEHVEFGNEIVDLQMLGLSSLPNAILEPLSELEVIPTVTKDVAFYPRSPKLHLYLGSNQLSRAPGPIFTIEFLTNLSLRGNQLTELPPSISRLRNLKFLNVSQNRLRYLPAELLDLILSPNGALSDGLHIHPNPFFQPEGAPRDRLFARLANQEWSGDDLNVVFQLARSPIQYCDSSGVVYSDFRFAPLPASSLHGHQIDDDNASRLLPAEWHPAILQAAPITTLEAALPDAPVMFLAADSSTSSRTPPYDSSASTGQAAAEAKLHLPAQHFARLASSSSSLVPTLFELCLRTVSRLHSSLGKMPLPVVRRRGGFQAATRMSAKSQHCLADMLPPHLPPHIRERVMDVCIATDEEALGFCTVCEVRRRRTAVEGQESRRRRNSENTGNKSVSASETQPNAVPPSQSQQSQLSPSSATAAPAITPHSTAPVVMRTSTAPVSSGSCGPAPLRPMLVPRTGWIEWFKLSSTGRGMDDRLMPVSDSEDGGAPRLFELISGAGSDGRAFEDAVPFVRRGCSWKCVPGATDDETVSERGEESSHGYGRGWLPGGFTRTWRV